MELRVDQEDSGPPDAKGVLRGLGSKMKQLGSRVAAVEDLIYRYL